MMSYFTLSSSLVAELYMGQGGPQTTHPKAKQKFFYTKITKTPLVIKEK
jgi:hypothetical protein